MLESTVSVDASRALPRVDSILYALLVKGLEDESAEMAILVYQI
jgi:hypothetical protein